jgi:hypothetical protein
MPGEVQVKKGSEIQAPDGSQTDGMVRMPAIVDKSDQICGTGKTRMFDICSRVLTVAVMIAKPHTASAVHHHGEEGTLWTLPDSTPVVAERFNVGHIALTHPDMPQTQSYMQQRVTAPSSADRMARNDKSYHLAISPSYQHMQNIKKSTKATTMSYGSLHVVAGIP